MRVNRPRVGKTRWRNEIVDYPGLDYVMRRASLHLRVLPATRAECVDGARPCPLVSCRYHLLLEVGSDGRLLRSRDFDEQDPDSIVDVLVAMDETCALDARAKAPGGLNSTQIGKMAGTNPEQIRQDLQRAVGRIRDAGLDWDVREHPEDPYLRYTVMGEDELAEVTAELRERQRDKS